MSFDQLPYEIQFQYLLGLSQPEIINYCQTSQAGQLICQSDYFWDQKSLNDFGISIEILKEGTGAERYAALKKKYEDTPHNLVIPLLSADQTELIPELLRRSFSFSQADFDCQFTWLIYFERLSEILREAYYLGSKKLWFLLESLKSLIAPENWSGLTDELRSLYLQAIRDSNPEMIKIIEQYWNAQNDPYLESDYYRAMNDGDLQVVRYLHEIIGPLIGPYAEMASAIKSLNRSVIDYFNKLYPEILQDQRFVEDLANELTEVDYPEALDLLKQLTR